MKDTMSVPAGARLNYCVAVLNALHAMGVSSVKVVNAVNGVVAKAEVIKHDATLGAPTVTKETKKRESVTRYVSSEKMTVEAPTCVVTRFDKWATLIGVAAKFSHFDKVSIPEEFTRWLMKFAPEPLNATPENTEEFAAHTGEQ